MIAETLIETVASMRQISEAELGRHLGVDRGRLHQWKSYRRRMPTRVLYQLATMAGWNVPNVVGQYAVEWESVKVRRGKTAPVVAPNHP